MVTMRTVNVVMRVTAIAMKMKVKWMLDIQGEQYCICHFEGVIVIDIHSGCHGNETSSKRRKAILIYYTDIFQGRESKYFYWRASLRK